jgi:hypothetical protein
MFEKKFAKKVQKYYKLSEGREGREGGWRIVIPMPEAINFVDGRRQKPCCLAGEERRLSFEGKKIPAHMTRTNVVYIF